MKINKVALENLEAFGFILLLCMLPLYACNSSDDRNINDDVNTINDDLIKEAFFNSTSLISYQKVDCTLEDGSESECYKLVFSSNPINNGPFCPETLDDVGGLGIYDGDTNPGFQVLNASLFNAMEEDGYDIIGNNGEIYIDDFTGPPNPGGFSYCQEAVPDNNLQLTFLIPTVPVLATNNNIIDIMELIGVSINGVPINGDPPSVVDGPMLGVGNIPAIDPCGGHHDPSGYYHLHFIAETMNQVLISNGINDLSCTLVNQVSGRKLVGFAKDGFPIYAYETEPSGLDECGGFIAATTEYPDGVYHYVASNTEAPNVPKCLKGLSATNSFTLQ
ncbi:YHYH protein [Psychroserpens mesophilus]|uniref:YHYH protein n=1 Tax=Psychroserpens mesophilus TaxID=325473 RepID=UPI003D6578F5